ncbi:hypothetical protein OROHE_016230 [Orobanche hederae]
MRPHFNSRPHNPNSNQPQIYGNNAPTPQQVMANPGNFCPNPTPMVLPQFQFGMLNNPQFAMPPPFPNQQNAFFAPNQLLLPFAQAQMHNLNNNNNLQQLLMHNALSMPNLVQNANKLLQMQMANAQLGMDFNGNMRPPVNGNGVVQQPMNGYDSNQVNPDAATPQSNVGPDNALNWKNSPNKKSNWNPNRDASQSGHTKQLFHQGQNAKGNLKFHNNGKDQENRAKNLTSGSSKPKQEGKKRSLAFNYTAQEIRQWREERKKNYPREKGLKEMAGREVVDAATKARRQQLKDILAKQAELGCPVAEIPSNYLSDSKQHQQANGGRANKRVFGKNERFQNRFDKRGKFREKNDRFSKRDNGQTNTQDQNDRFSKKQRRTSGCPANFRTENQREPSLLKKLLSSDISRDKKHLMQVFRFMVMNSFFKNLTEKPLKFPVVVVKETGDEGWKGESSNGGIEKIADITNNETSVVLGGDAVSCDRNDVGCNGGEEEGEITD